MTNVNATFLNNEIFAAMVAGKARIWNEDNTRFMFRRDDSIVLRTVDCDEHLIAADSKIDRVQAHWDGFNS